MISAEAGLASLPDEPAQRSLLNPDRVGMSKHGATQAGTELKTQINHAAS